MSALILKRFDQKFVQSLINEPIESFSINTGSNKGDNVAGDIYSIKIHTKSKNTENLVIKVFPEAGGLLRTVAKENQMFATEILMYTILPQKIKNLVEKFGLIDEELLLPMPKYYNGLCDGENDFLALEDERPAGYKMANKYIGLNINEVSLILKQLAKFHALTYFLIKYEGEQIFKYDDNDNGLKRISKSFWNDDSNPMVKILAQALFGTSFEIAIKKIEEKMGKEIADRIKNVIQQDKVGEIFRKTCKLTDVKTFPVISHGDFWTNNILIKYDEKSNPVAVKFIDFQQSRRGNIYEDLGYFIFASTTSEFRKNYLEQSLSIYFDSFNTTLTKFNCPLPFNFTKGILIDTFYDCYIPIYIHMLYAIPLQLGKHSDDDKKADTSSDESPIDRDKAFADWMANIERLYRETPETMERLDEINKEFMELNIF